MKQHLAVSAIGSDRTGMVHELTRVISESGGNISESRMANLGTEFAMLLLVSGHWPALAKLETELKRLAETSNLSIHLKRTEPRAARTDMLPYSIDVVCLDQSGIVSGLSGFFATRGIDIAEVSTRSYPAAHTGAPMFAVQMIVNVPQVSRFLDDMMRDVTKEQIDRGLQLPSGYSGNHGKKPSTGRLFFQTRQLGGELPQALPGQGADNGILAQTLALQNEHPDARVILVSKDINLRIKAAVLGVHAEDYYSDKTLEDADVL